MRFSRRSLVVTATLLLAVLVCRDAQAEKAAARPNILFAIADDWGWPHAGAYGDPVVKTPVFDRIAKEGILFQHAYVSSPSCTPSRGAILTGQFHWRLEGAANLWSVFPDRFKTYTDYLGDAGYVVGRSGKCWGPGRPQTRSRQVGGKPYPNFQRFLDQLPKDKPFCYWLGTSDPHRPYKRGSGVKSGMKLKDIRLPGCFPDSPEVRSDVADYYFEVQRFDSLVGRAMQSLSSKGLLDNTIVVMTGDHGMPFPRCKSNLYDTGSRVPLAIRWPKGILGGRIVTDFVSLTDLAPTFLQAAQRPIPKDMTGRSLASIFASSRAGRIEDKRNFVLTGKERHVPSQEKPDMGGYPCRSLRTDKYLLIRNYRPDRWPAGTPDYEKAAVARAWLADCDNGPTKTYMVQNRKKDDVHQRLYDASFGKRSEYELFDVAKDPEQLTNVAANPEYTKVLAQLKDRLTAELKRTGDPRADGKGDHFDRFPYLGGAPKFPGGKKKK